MNFYLITTGRGTYRIPGTDAADARTTFRRRVSRNPILRVDLDPGHTVQVPLPR